LLTFSAISKSELYGKIYAFIGNDGYIYTGLTMLFMSEQFIHNKENLDAVDSIIDHKIDSISLINK
jgi:hypothetical protein